MIKKILIFFVSLILFASCTKLPTPSINNCEEEDIVTAIGEYSYINYGTNYGAKVRVKIDKNKNVIKEVAVIGTDEFTNLTVLKEEEPNEYWTEENRDNWFENELSYLDSFRGVSIDNIKTIEVNTPENYLNINYKDLEIDSVAGATQSSARIVKAIQNAIDNYLESLK